MVGKLNYSKWDNLELSDDSDVEVHPNVDKKSFIRWKQRDIHEKREERKARLDNLRAESETSKQLLPKLDELAAKTKADGSSFYSREVSRLSAGRAERGNKDGPNGPTMDDMILSLLLQINEEPAVKGKSGSELDDALVKALGEHRAKLAKRKEEVDKGIEEIEEEDKRKITSDSLRDGFSSSHINKPSESSASASTTKGKAKATETQIETINSPAAASAAADKKQSAAKSSSDDDDDDEEVPTLTVAMQEFAHLPACVPMYPPTTSSLPATFLPRRDVREDHFETAYRFLSDHRELLDEKAGATDALLVEAFQSAMSGEIIYARKCAEKALLIQYCNKLGKDGVSLFFKRMTQTDGRAAAVFFNDVLSTFARIYTRARELKGSGSTPGGGQGEEQIQLVAEDPSTVISFEIPDGPPPEHIELEGEGAEGMDIERVREFLQTRWDIFQGFDDRLKEALKTKELEKVNKVLGAMSVDEAEDVVKKLDQAGILSFSSSETGKA